MVARRRQRCDYACNPPELPKLPARFVRKASSSALSGGIPFRRKCPGEIIALCVAVHIVFFRPRLGRLSIAISRVKSTHLSLVSIVPISSAAAFAAEVKYGNDMENHK
jgi:hypothetical protein